MAASRFDFSAMDFTSLSRNSQGNTHKLLNVMAAVFANGWKANCA